MVGGIPAGIVTMDLTHLRGPNGEPLGQIGGMGAFGEIQNLVGGISGNLF